MKNWKTILIFILIFALLGSAYFFLEHYTPPQTTPTLTAAPQIPILSLDGNRVCEIQVENATGSFAFLRSENGWSVKDNPFALLHNDRVETLSFSATTLSAVSQITAEAENLSEFGLEKPQATISLSLADAAPTIFYIGNQTPTGDGYYACLADNRTVYELSSTTASPFLSPLRAFRVMEISSFSPADLCSVTIQKNGSVFKISRAEIPENSQPGAVSTWRIESPIKRDADDKLVQELLLQPLSSLVAADVAADAPESLSPFGFSGDTVTISTKTETLRFSVGNSADAWYILPDGTKTVYFMGTTSLPFMTVTPFDVLEKMTNLISLDTIEAIDISFPGTSVSMKISRFGSEMQFYVNDALANEDTFKSMYIEIAALSVDGMVETPPSEGVNPTGTIVYTLTDKSAITLAYFPYDTFNYVVSENGESTFYIKKTKLSALCDKLLSFAQNPNG